MEINSTEAGIYSGTQEKAPTGRETRHAALARKIAAEGMVLLKNDGLLPLKEHTPLALLGGGAVKTVKGGTGSGDVNNRESISICQGMREAGAPVVSGAWLDDYAHCYEAARNAWKEKVLEDAKHVDNPFDAYAANPFTPPVGRAVMEEDIRGAQAAVYVISRISGEGKDRRRLEGDYYLSQRETEDIRFLCKCNLPVVLVLNAGGPVELTHLLGEAENIRAVLNISQPGQEGGRAVADVLFGRAVPGGRLTATWAKRYEDYPEADSYSYLNGDLETEEYREGIYVGYRYFDTFGVVPLFPFGYGLSYTEFDIRFEQMRVMEDGIEVDVTVENIKDRYTAREVVQVYMTLPRNGGEKEYHRLVGFAKTKPLRPGETQCMTITVEQKRYASFSGELHAWYIGSGSYGVWIGKNSAELELAAELPVSERKIIERTYPIYTGADGNRPSPEEKTGLGLSPEEKTGLGQPPEETAGIEPPLEELLPTHSAAELMPLLYGNMTECGGVLGNAGIRVPGSAGETTGALEEAYNIRPLVMADGPAGLRLRQSYEVDRRTGTVYGTGVLGTLENGFLEPVEHHGDADIYYQFCTAFPVGTALAQTWDTDIMYSFGRAVAAEMKEFHVDLWLAPGMNIQRNPLCGRNFEYYSEDPLLSGEMAAAVTRGVQETKGCGVTIKHFACNNQEDNRMGVNVCVSERALREIYFRGFEIAVKKGKPVAVMTSYNLINGVHAANSRDLCTVVARGEWGFDGIIMSDWNTTEPEDGSVSWKCAAAGNDIIMPGSPKDAADIRKAYEQGLLTDTDIRSCAGRIVRVMRRLGAL